MKEIAKYISKIDKNGDALIDFEEFKIMMKNYVEK
jgi:Ca2+-binding EF-hand superfamily protein